MVAGGGAVEVLRGGGAVDVLAGAGAGAADVLAGGVVAIVTGAPAESGVSGCAAATPASAAAGGAEIEPSLHASAVVIGSSPASEVERSAGKSRPASSTTVSLGLASRPIGSPGSRPIRAPHPALVQAVATSANVTEGPTIGRRLQSGMTTLPGARRMPSMARTILGSSPSRRATRRRWSWPAEAPTETGTLVNGASTCAAERRRSRHTALHFHDKIAP